MLTLERAKELAQQIVSENPDFVYNRTEDGSNFCFNPAPFVGVQGASRERFPVKGES